MVWAQNSNALSRILILQKKVARVINFKSNCHSSPLFSNPKLLKFNDKILFENVLLISKFINSLLPPAFTNCFIFWSNIHNYETTSTTTFKILVLFYNSIYLVFLFIFETTFLIFFFFFFNYYYCFFIYFLLFWKWGNILFLCMIPYLSYIIVILFICIFVGFCLLILHPV